VEKKFLVGKRVMMKRIFYWCPECEALYPWLEVVLGYDLGEELETLELWKVENGKPIKLEENEVSPLSCSPPRFVLIMCPEGHDLSWNSGYDLSIKEGLSEASQLAVEYNPATGEVEIPQYLQDELTPEQVKKLLAELV
jgi:hypothetical protein